MIANIKTRVDFGGIVNYANDQKKKRATLLAYKGVCIISNKTIADSFQVQADMHPKIKSPVKHVSLAFSPKDLSRFPDNEKGNALMTEIALKWMEQMGFKNTQYIITRHHDTRHPHCHLVINRIDNDGNPISDSNERVRSAKICRVLTEQYGLYIAPKNSKERNKNRLRPSQLRKYNLRSAVLDSLTESKSWYGFLHSLKMRNIDTHFRVSKDNESVKGISFSDDETSMAGSSLDKDLSFNSICTKLGDFIEEVILQPHQAFVPSVGGGSNNDRGWRDKDEKDKNKYINNRHSKRKR